VPHGPRLRVGLGIGDGDVDFHPAEVHATKAFGQPGLIGQRRADDVEPPIVAQVVGFDDKRIAFPFA
jgi:hypothetical protein